MSADRRRAAEVDGRIRRTTGRMLLALGTLMGTAACAPQGPFAPPPETVKPADALMAEGTRFLRLGEPDHAYDRFVQAFRTGAPPAAALTGAGLALERQGLLHRARDLLEQARDLAPGAVNTQNNLGVVYYKLGDYPAARQAFRAAFAVSNGESGVALANLRAAERALAARAPRQAEGITHSVQRLGGDRYRIDPWDPAAAAPVIPLGSPISEAPAPVAEPPSNGTRAVAPADGPGQETGSPDDVAAAPAQAARETAPADAESPGAAPAPPEPPLPGDGGSIAADAAEDADVVEDLVDPVAIADPGEPAVQGEQAPTASAQDQSPSTAAPISEDPAPAPTPSTSDAIQR